MLVFTHNKTIKIKQLCLTETGGQQKFHEVYIDAAGAQLIFVS